MITTDAAKNIVEKNFKGAKVKEIYYWDDGKKYYMVVAPRFENDPNDPFYLVGINDGKYRFINPMED
ncbi:hypothetical protein, partial [Pseudobutyrivibrio sp.]